MIHVITTGPHGTRLEDDRSRGVVVLESDLGQGRNGFQTAHEELTAQVARHHALGFANQNGVADARLNGNATAPYPVNADGVPLPEVRDRDTGAALPLTHPRMRPHRYRVDVPVTRRLV